MDILRFLVQVWQLESFSSLAMDWEAWVRALSFQEREGKDKARSNSRGKMGWSYWESCFLHLFSSVQFSCSVVSDSLWPHESQHDARPPCPSPTPGVHSNSRQPKGKYIMKQNQDFIFIKAKYNMLRFKDIHWPVFFKFNEKECYFWRISSVQSLSHVRLFLTPWTVAHHTSLSITNSRSPPKPMSIVLVMPSSHPICRPLLLLPSIFPSIRVFSNESALHIRWPEYWSFSFNISPSNEHPGLISFRMHWLDLLAVQGTLKSLLQHHSSKASILWHSGFL